MRRTSLWTICAIALIWLQPVALRGEGLPFPFAPLEMVFPVAQHGTVSFQNRELTFETQFSVVNPEDEDAFVELAFHPNALEPEQRGFLVPARSFQLIALPLPPGTDEVPVPGYLSGWVRVRANQPVQIQERVTLRDSVPGERVMSSVPISGYPQPLVEVNLPVTLNTPNTVTSTGLTIVNPRQVTATLTVELLRSRLEGMDLVAERELVVPPGTRLDFVANAFFDDVDPAELGGPGCELLCNSGIVRIRAQGGSDFVAEAIDFLRRSQPLGGQTFNLIEYRTSPNFDLAGVPQRTEQFNPEGWRFPVSVVRVATLRGRVLRLSPFQLELEAGDLGLPDAVAVSPGGELLVNESAGIAVATGPSREQVVFLAEEGLVLRVALQGFAQAIVDIPERNGFEIAVREDYQSGFGAIPIYNHVLIDRATGEILDRFVAVTIGAPPTPPWRG